MRYKQPNRYQTASLFLLALLISLIFLNAPGTVDVGAWFLNWAKTLHLHGLAAGFKIIDADYPPLQSVILLGVARISSILNLELFSVFKLSLLLFLILSALVCWYYTRDVFVTLLLILSLQLNSVAFGYIDIYYTPALLAALFMLKERRLLPFTCMYTIAFLTKWQSIIIAPTVALYILNINSTSSLKQIEFRKIIFRVLLPATIIFILVIAIFGFEPLLSAWVKATNRRYLSANALNFNWIITHFLHIFKSDLFGNIIDGQAGIVKLSPSHNIMRLPKSLFILFYLYTLVMFFKREKSFENLAIFSLLGYLSYFMFNPGVHENHLFIAAIISIILFWENKNYLPTMIVIVLMCNINLFLFYGLDGSGLRFNRAIGATVDTALLLAVFNVIFFLVFWAQECLFHRVDVEHSRKLGG